MLYASLALILASSSRVESLGFIHHSLVSDVVALAVNTQTPALDVLLQGAEPPKVVWVDCWDCLVEMFMHYKSKELFK